MSRAISKSGHRSGTVLPAAIAARRVAVCCLALLIHGVSAAASPDLLNDEERLWLATLERPVAVGAEASFRPYAYIDENGALSGMAGDYLALLERRLGMRFAILEYDSFADVLEGARKREIDVVPFTVASSEKQSYLNFTQPFLSIKDRILTRVETKGNLSIDDLAGLRVGLIEGYAIQAELARDHPEIVVVPLINELVGVRALSIGNVDALIVDLGAASYYIEQEGLTNLHVVGEIGTGGEQTFGTRNDWPLLNSIIGKGLASISQKEHEQILRRWINIGDPNAGQWRRARGWIAAIAGAVLLLAVVILFWNLSLRRLVAKRTVDLEQELVQRRRVEAAKERLAVAVDQTAEFVIIINTAGQIEYSNLSFQTANASSSIDSRPFVSLALDSDRETLAQALQQLQSGGIWRGRVMLSGNGAGAIQVAMTIAPIYGDNKQVDGYVATGRDVSHEQQLEARLRHGEKLTALGTLAGGVAHDFNNLLVPILGYTDLIREQSPSTNPEYLDAISSAAKRARELVQRILTFSRHHERTTEPLDLVHEVNDSIPFLRSLLPTTTAIETQLAMCGTVMGDRTQIQQILLNLGTNASDAMEQGTGTLTIRLQQFTVSENSAVVAADLAPGEYSLLTVCDTGEGMDSDTQARAFEPYYTNKPQGKGTGLGLATVHGIVSAHNGAIRIESTPGSGTCINIYFPIVDDQPTLLNASAAPAPAATGGQRIMVLDDDELVLQTVCSMLKKLGYEVSAWSDPAGALADLAATPHGFTAILSDFTMPGMNGRQFAEQSRAIKPDIPVILMTGNADAVRDCEFVCITKPMRLGDLSNCLAAIGKG